jgi:O-antigen/teichoic acid export membrane protein
MDQATNRFVAPGTSAGRDEEVPRTVGTALRVVVLSGLIIAAGVFFAAPWIAAARHDPACVTPLRALSTVPIFYHVTTVFITATQATHVMRYGFWARGVVQPLVLLGLTVVALRAGAGVLGVCLALLAGMALTAALAAVFYGRLFPLRPTLEAALRGPMDEGMLRFAGPLVSAGVLTAVLGYIDMLLLGLLGVRAAEVGFYAMCLLYAQTLSQVRSVFDPSVQALIPPLYERGDRAALRSSLARQTRWSMALAAPVFVLFAGFSDVVLRVFGREFSHGAAALAILCVGQVVNALALTAWLLPGTGHTRVTARLSVVWATIETVALCVLVPRYGINGAALAAALGLAGLQISQSFAAWKITGVHGYSVALVKTALVAGAALLVGRAALALAPGGLVARFGVAITLAALVYLGLSFVTAHEEDKGTARALVRRFSRRG